MCKITLFYDLSQFSCFHFELCNSNFFLTCKIFRTCSNLKFSAIASSDCLVFDTSVAKMFSENGNLGINVTISQTSMNTVNYKQDNYKTDNYKTEPQ